MKEIKYKGWHKLQKREFVVRAVIWKDGVIEDVVQEDGLRMDAENIILREFTGLTDKNGKEIYEGDIISGWLYGEPDIREVRWDEDKWGWSENPKTPSSNFEVIGNVWENPELLKADD